MMTEREPNPELLAELLDKPLPAGDSATRDNPILTRRDEQKLLDEANRVEPTTLAPVETITEPLTHAGGQPAATIVSFGAEVAEIVRRHPVPALLLTVGVVYFLTRRRKA